MFLQLNLTRTGFGTEAIPVFTTVYTTWADREIGGEDTKKESLNELLHQILAPPFQKADWGIDGLTLSTVSSGANPGDLKANQWNGRGRIFLL